MQRVYRGGASGGSAKAQNRCFLLLKELDIDVRNSWLLLKDHQIINKLVNNNVYNFKDPNRQT